MIRTIAGLPGGVIGFEAGGTVTARDYETVLMPAVDAATAGGRKLCLLYHIASGFEKFELGAMWDDARIGFRHLASWKKIAVVTDVEWIRSAVKLFRFALSAPVRTFANADLDAAKSWLAEGG